MYAPLISVIIPVFNGERFIQAAIESVLSQTYEKIEVIVVDDGSTDHTPEKLRVYSGRIKIIALENSGTPSVPRNLGCAEAKGQFIAFLDHDDTWQSDKLRQIVEILEKNRDVGFLFSDFNRFEWRTGSRFALSNSQINPFIYDEVKMIRWVDHKYFRIERERMYHLLLRGYPVYPSTMVVDRDLWRKVKWNVDLSIRGNEDFDFSLNCCEHSDAIYIDERLVNVGRHEGNMSLEQLNQKEGDLRVIEIHLNKKKSQRKRNAP
jgi:glycosyltransferase involved in cell wall biosynthesis